MRQKLELSPPTTNAKLTQIHGRRLSHVANLERGADHQVNNFPLRTDWGFRTNRMKETSRDSNLWPKAMIPIVGMFAVAPKARAINARYKRQTYPDPWEVVKPCREPRRRCWPPSQQLCCPNNTSYVICCVFRHSNSREDYFIYICVYSSLLFLLPLPLSFFLWQHKINKMLMFRVFYNQ